jgi:hypothetical protein
VPPFVLDLASVRLRLAILLGGALVVGGGCRRAPVNVDPELATLAGSADALALYDRLEALIAAQKDAPQDREFAYQAIQGHDDGTAGYAFARAAITGRLAELHGMAAGSLVGEAERWARRSRQLDPEFRDGAAARMLGVLYVLAPARLLEHGDSEEGLAILEDLTERRPDVLENHLRLAEAYLALGDEEPAHSHLCTLLGRRAELPRDHERLLLRLVEDVGGAGRLGCEPGDSGP